MSTAARKSDESSARASMRWASCLICLGLIAPLSVAIADQPMPAHRTLAELGAQSHPASAEPTSTRVYAAGPPTSGIAMSVDAQGHLRALCADPADSLSPAAMRDAIESDTSRLRYE